MRDDTMKLLQPTLPASLTTISDVTDFLRDDDTLSEASIDSESFTGLKLKQLHISESLLVKSDFSHIAIEHLDVLDVALKGCNFTASKFPNSSWHVALIDGARCSGTMMSNSVFKNVTFKNSKLELVNFRFSRFENIVFEGCTIDDADFYNATLKNVEFINCTINSVTFASARMSNVDISKSHIEGIKGVNSLKGVTISYDQLMQLAASLADEAGIKVK